MDEWHGALLNIPTESRGKFTGTLVVLSTLIIACPWGLTKVRDDESDWFT